jgi:type II restriction/modification system DNA methylase subunit YeeA
LDGADVRIAIVGFDNGEEKEKACNGHSVDNITSDLSTDMDFTRVPRLTENTGCGYIGDTKKGKFDISPEVAVKMINAPLNPNGRPNSDVIRPWINASDVVKRPRGMWIVDFGIDMSEAEASFYELPFQYVLENIKPVRDLVRNPLEKSRWWLHGRPAPDLRVAIKGLKRYITTPVVSKHRIFVWTPSNVLPDHAVTIFAREDDYFFGVLHSKVHEMWSLRMCTWLGIGNDPRYTPSTTFETFPFPWPPGREPAGDPRVEAIAAAARRLVELRDNWLNPPGASPAELKARTLTNLYNQRPTWLANAHTALDAAVLAAYDWPADLGDEEILERLLALNLARAAGQGAVAPVAQVEEEEEATE